MSTNFKLILLVIFGALILYIITNFFMEYSSTLHYYSELQQTARKLQEDQVASHQQIKILKEKISRNCNSASSSEENSSSLPPALLPPSTTTTTQKPGSNLPFIPTRIRRVGFFLMGTGRYIRLVQQLLESMETHFCAGRHYVHYFIFTDDKTYMPKLNTNPLSPPGSRNFTRIYQERLGWPKDTLMRFEMLLRHKDALRYEQDFDYLYWLDADMKMVDEVCEDIFGDLVATAHPHYPPGRETYPYETNQRSTAFVEQHNQDKFPYFVGAFFGGSSREMIKLMQTCHENIQADFNNLDGYIARVHDESHLNRYFIDHPTQVLTPSYCYPEPPDDTNKFPWMKRYKQKIHALIKDSKYFRELLG